MDPRENAKYELYKELIAAVKPFVGGPLSDADIVTTIDDFRKDTLIVLLEAPRHKKGEKK